MSLAYIIAAFCFLVTMFVTACVVFGYNMSEDMRKPAIGIFVGGTLFSILIALSHLVPWHW